MTVAYREAHFDSSDIESLIDVLSADLSRDGERVVFCANTIDGTSALERGVLWNSRGASEPELLGGVTTGSQLAPAISPDDRQVAFLEEVEDVAQVRVLSFESGEASTLTDFARGVCSATPAWSPDQSMIAFVGCQDEPRDETKPLRVTDPIWRRDGLGLVEDTKGDVYVVPATGGDPVRLTSSPCVISSLEWSPDGSKLLYVCVGEKGSEDFFIKTLTLESRETRVVFSGPDLVYLPVAAWLPDGRVLHTSEWKVNKALDLEIWDPKKETRSKLGVGFAGQLFGRLQPGMCGTFLEPKLLVSDSGDSVLASVQDRGRMVAVEVALKAPFDCREVFSSDQSTIPLQLKGDTLLLAHTSFSRPVSIEKVDLPSGAATGVVGWVPSALEEPPFTVHPFQALGCDGVPIDAWYLEPKSGVGPYPTVLNLHGGPFSGHGEMFSVDNFLLTSAGFGVLSVNFRGSSGYGEQFAATLWGEWGTLDADDTLRCLDEAESAGWADPSRVGSFGLSGGGFMTLWLLTHSDRIRAGVAEAPVADWHTMIGSDIPRVVELWLGDQGGSGTESMAAYSRMSPLTYAASCNGPTLLIEHEADLRCPPAQGDSMYNALYRHGVHVEMLRMPGMFHVDSYGIERMSDRIVRADALVDWFTRYLV